jgi:hypothetical protein
MDSKDDAVTISQLKQVEYKRFEKISPEVFEAYLEAHGVKSDCFSCGSSARFIPTTMDLGSPSVGSESGSGFSYVTPTLAQSELFSPVNSASYDILCSNCGVISRYKALHIIMWAGA